MPELEGRARRLTGAVLGVMAFAACYALLLIEDQTSQARVHLYPLVAGVLFYLAGDLVALIWFRLLASQMQAYLKRIEVEQRELARRIVAGEDAEAVFGADDDDAVEVIKPGAH